MGRAFYDYDQSRRSTLAIDAQFGMIQGDYMVEYRYHERFPQCRYS